MWMQWFSKSTSKEDGIIVITIPFFFSHNTYIHYIVLYFMSWIIKYVNWFTEWTNDACQYIFIIFTIEK